MMPISNDKKTIIVPTLPKPMRLDRFLAELDDFDLSRAFFQKIIGDGLVTINSVTVSKNHKVKGGETIELIIPPQEALDISPENIPLDIRYEDDTLAIINKPVGMVVHPAPGNPQHTLVNAIMYHFGPVSVDTSDFRPGIIHRLDKQTSGLIIIAKNDSIARKMRKLFADRKVTKIYHAIVCGNMPEEQGTIDLPIGRSLKDRKKMAVTHRHSREAITHYKVLSRYRMNDYLEIRLETGRTHQIRVHLTHMHRPVFGDSEYGGRQKWLRGIDPSLRKAGKELLGLIDRQALHAQSITFTHPLSGETISISCDLPDDIKQVKQALDDRFPA